MATLAPEARPWTGSTRCSTAERLRTEEQLGRPERLREIGADTIRPLAAESHRTLTGPRESLEALGPDGIPGTARRPKERGGLVPEPT